MKVCPEHILGHNELRKQSLGSVTFISNYTTTVPPGLCQARSVLLIAEVLPRQIIDIADMHIVVVSPLFSKDSTYTTTT